jgi:hypothetical protein
MGGQLSEQTAIVRVEEQVAASAVATKRSSVDDAAVGSCGNSNGTSPLRQPNSSSCWGASGIRADTRTRHPAVQGSSSTGQYSDASIVPVHRSSLPFTPRGSSDGFVSALDGTLTVVRGERTERVLAPDGEALVGLATVADGRLIAGAGRDAVFLWTARDGVLRATLRGSLAIFPDGKFDLLRGDEGLGCRFGPFRFPLELCRRQLVEPGAFRRAMEAAL